MEGLGTLDWAPALDRRDLLAAPVVTALTALPADEAATVLVAPIDPALADTAAFCDAYDVGLDVSANCVVVSAERGGDEPARSLRRARDHPRRRQRRRAAPRSTPARRRSPRWTWPSPRPGWSTAASPRSGSRRVAAPRRRRRRRGRSRGHRQRPAPIEAGALGPARRRVAGRHSGGGSGQTGLSRTRLRRTSRVERRRAAPLPSPRHGLRPDARAGGPAGRGPRGRPGGRRAADVPEDAWIVGHYRAFAVELADRGWLGMTWPVEEGGRGRAALERFVVFEALIGAGAPIAAVVVRRPPDRPDPPPVRHRRAAARASCPTSSPARRCGASA